MNVLATMLLFLTVLGLKSIDKLSIIVYNIGMYMKKLLLVLSLFVTTAQGQLLTPAEAMKEVEKTCAEGCLVISKEDIQGINKAFQYNLEKAAEAAYAQGVSDGVEAAKANPKICLRNA